MRAPSSPGARSSLCAPRAATWGKGAVAAFMATATFEAHAQPGAPPPAFEFGSVRPRSSAPISAPDPSPDPPGSLVTLSFEDATLAEVVHSMSVMSGKRFVIAAAPKAFHADVVAPQKVTVAEAYRALLSVLASNHLTVVPAGSFEKIVEAGDAAHEAPVHTHAGDVPSEDRFVTLVHRVAHAHADELATGVLTKLASREGQVLVYGGAIIVTDTGTNVRRMMQVLDELDVAAAEDLVWLEPLKYAVAADVKKELDELIDLKETKDRDARITAAGTAHVTRIVALDRPNSILVVGTPGGYRRLLDLLREIDVPQPAGGQMYVVMLEHAEAKKLVAALNDAVTAATGAQGQTKDARPLSIFDSPVKVSAEETNNALIVTASAHDFAAVSDVIRRLDRPRRQVYIEGVVMDLTIDDATQVGAALHGFGDLSGSLGPGAAAFGGVNPMSSIALPTDPTALQGLVLGLRGPSIPVPGFLQNVVGTSTIPGVGFLIDASTVSSNSNIVQSPSVMTTDNVPAEFHMQLNTSLQRNAPSVALPTAGAGGATAGAAASYLPYSAPASQNYGKIGPMLQVTPHLNESDDVRLDIEETLSDLTPDPPQGTLGTVSFIERHALTTLTVKDGGTAVVGGLVRNTVQHTATKVPVLGDLPLLGVFFRTTSDVVSRANLVLVLTPHIIRDEDDMRRVVGKRMEERQQFLDHYMLFRDDQGPPVGFDPVRGRGLIGEMLRESRNVVDERRLAQEAALRPPATHEEHAPLELPNAGGAAVVNARSGPRTLPPAPAAPAVVKVE